MSVRTLNSGLDVINIIKNYNKQVDKIPITNSADRHLLSIPASKENLWPKSYFPCISDSSEELLERNGTGMNKCNNTKATIENKMAKLTIYCFYSFFFLGRIF